MSYCSLNRDSSKKKWDIRTLFPPQKKNVERFPIKTVRNESWSVSLKHTRCSIIHHHRCALRLLLCLATKAAFNKVQHPLRSKTRTGNTIRTSVNHVYLITTCSNKRSIFRGPFLILLLLSLISLIVFFCSHVRTLYPFSLTVRLLSKRPWPVWD